MQKKWFKVALVILVFVGMFYALSLVKAEVDLPVTSTRKEFSPLVARDVFAPAEEGVTESVVTIPKPLFPNPEQLRLIGRLSESIYRWKSGYKDGVESYPFYECGIKYSGEAAKERSALWAYHIVKASWEASEEDYTLNPWGVAGTTAHESRFDLCALGTNPRTFAYETKFMGVPILSRSKLTISHTRESVISAIRNPKMLKRFKSYDLGGLQILTEYCPFNMEKLMTWDGYYWQVNWMAKKGRRNKTKRPWGYWPGRWTEWYALRVQRKMKALGATSDDISFLK